MPAGKTYIKIASQTLGSATSSVTFSSISGSYTDLRLIINGSVTSGAVNGILRFNNDTGSNYSSTYLTGTGSAASSGRASNQTEILLNYYGYFGTVAGGTNYLVEIQNYSNATTYKTLLSRSNNAANGTAAVAGLWRSTAAVNRIDILTDSSTFTAGSTFSLYGIAASKAPKAIGGTVTTDGSYWIHTFTSSGLFIPQESIDNADYLVVAGGGGGGDNNHGGGGGAGGVRSTVTATGGGGSLESALSLTANTSYTVTVGAGGNAAPTGGNANGSQGNNSVFATITATGGGYGAGYNNIGGSGGSGGGSGGNQGTKSTVSPSGQGNIGGAYGPASNGPGSGGGGAGATGGNGSGTYPNGSGGAGGNGVAVSISGSSVTYGGGGGGGSNDGISTRASGGTGGGGFGGAGGSGGTNGTAGSANTGGGGGGGGGPSPYAASAGGSGIVIVRYPV